MATSRYYEIITWLEEAKKKGCTHMLVVCDTSNYKCYPVPVLANDNLDNIIQEHNKNMQSVIEIYSLTGKYTIENQLNEDCTNHKD